jgi:hypothetical protein
MAANNGSAASMIKYFPIVVDSFPAFAQFIAGSPDGVFLDCGVSWTGDIAGFEVVPPTLDRRGETVETKDYQAAEERVVGALAEFARIRLDYRRATRLSFHTSLSIAPSQ